MTNKARELQKGEAMNKLKRRTARTMRVWDVTFRGQDCVCNTLESVADHIQTILATRDLRSCDKVMITTYRMTCRRWRKMDDFAGWK